MMRDSTNKWKYLSFGLIGLLGIGFILPSASGASVNMHDKIFEIVEELKEFAIDTNDTVHTKSSQASVNAVQTTVNDIEAKTENLPASFPVYGSNEVTSDDLIVLVQTPAEGKVRAGLVTIEISGTEGDATLLCKDLEANDCRVFTADAVEVITLAFTIEHGEYLVIDTVSHAFQLTNTAVWWDTDA